MIWKKKKRSRRRSICLDFDGVLHSYESGWQGPRNITDPIVPGAASFLLEMLHEFNVIVLSARSRYIGGRRAMKRWLRCEVERTLPQEMQEVFQTEVPLMTADTAKFLARGMAKDIRWPKNKLPASLYIDDRGFTFKGSWPTVKEIKEFKPWNK